MSCWCLERVFHTTDVLKMNYLLNFVVRALTRLNSSGFLGERALRVDAYGGSVSLREYGRSCHGCGTSGR